MKKPIKTNQALLNEEIKKIQLINEYNFYVSEDFYNDETDEELILGDKELSEANDDLDAAVDDVAGELDGEDDMEIEPELDGEEDTDIELDGEAPLEDEPAIEEPALDGEDPMGDEAPMEEPMDDEVEIDVTELVNSSEESKQASEMTNQKMEDLMGQFGQLQGQLNKMDGLSTKIEDLEHEMETRMPTPEEKLEMRSLDSYPYNVKLTDYWADKEGQYDVMDGEDKNNGQPKEYVLTQDDVDTEYNEMDVKKSFKENPYEEEEF